MKKVVLIMILITVLYLSGCVNQPADDVETSVQLPLKKIGVAGKLDDNHSAYEILELTELDCWVLYLKRDKVTEKLGFSEDWMIQIGNNTYTLKKNPFNDNILKLLLPLNKKPSDITAAIVRQSTARKAGEIKTGEKLAIEKLFITKAEKNGTTLNAITLNDYTTLYPDADKNNFAYEEGTFIRPSHVVSNEENAYTKNTYFDARAAAVTHSATGAFDFLTQLENYENYIVMEDPNRFSINGAATQLLAPETRSRIRQLGVNAFSLVDDTANKQFILTINTDSLPVSYAGTLFALTQFHEATEVLFGRKNDTQLEKEIPYTDGASTEIVLNSRFTGVSDKILRFNSEGLFQKGYSVLNTAVTEAQDKDIIKIAGGTVVSPTNETAKLQGPCPVQSKELTVQSLNDEAVTLDGNKSFFHFFTGFATLKLENLILQNGLNNGLNGGSVYAMSSTITSVSCTFASNTTYLSHGGAIYSTGGNCFIEDSTFTGNGMSIPDIAGGSAIYLDTGDLSIDNTTFASNTSGNDGTVKVVSGNATITNSSFRDNSVFSYGGGMSLAASTFYVDNCLFDSNLFTYPDDSSTYKLGTGIYVYNASPGDNVIKNSTFKNMNGSKGSGIYVHGNSVKLHDNTFEDLNAVYSGGGVFGDTDAEIYNAAGAKWLIQNAPNTTIEQVENTTLHNNTYTNCSINNDTTAESAKVGWASRATPKGTLSLSQNSAGENERITLDIDYLIATAFREGSVTFNVPTGFEITGNASVIIDDVATSASVYAPSAQNITVTGIDLSAGTVTLRLEKQAVPDSITAPVSARDVAYTFNAFSDADGDNKLWLASPEDNESFTSISYRVITPTDITENYTGFKQAFDYALSQETATICVLTNQPVTLTDRLILSSGKTLTICPDGAATQVIFDGGNSCHLFEIFDASMILRDCVLKNGRKTTTVYGGAALDITNSHVQLHSCEIKDNLTTLKGGAIFAFNNTWLEIHDSTITTCQGDMGGAVYAAQSTITVSDSCISSCTGTTSGGAFSLYQSNGTFENSVIEANHAESGGGFMTAGSTVTLNDSTVTANTGVNGGGIAVSDEGGNFSTLWDIQRSNITENTAQDGGGIIRMGTQDNLIIRTNGHEWQVTGDPIETSFSVDDLGVVHIGDMTKGVKVFGNTATDTGAQLY